jgi:hypothetical protein
MFQRRRSSLSSKLQRANDPELAELYEELGRQRERVAELQLELFDAQAELTAFEREVDSRLGDKRQRLAELQKQLAEARHRADYRAQWGERADSDEPPVDVVEQFRRTWAPRPKRAEAARPPAEPAVDPGMIKNLYRALAKRYHPDLVTDPAEKRRREKVMAEVNQAYADKNLSALQALASRPEEPERESVKSRQQVIIELRREIDRLRKLVVELESRLHQLVHSSILELKLDVTIARRAGRDLLGEIAADLQKQITEIQIELATLD